MIIWLASYPRSGNTFIRIILKNIFGLETRSIYGDSCDVGADLEMSELSGHVELPADFDWTAARESNQLFVIKTHELFSDQHAKDKAIVLIRDGRDATVSFLNHQQNFGEATTIEKIIDGHPLGFTWAEHELSWREGGDAHLDVLFLKFEDFTKNQEKVIKSLGAFLKLNPKQKQLPAFSELQQVNSKFFSTGRSNYYGETMDVETQRYFWIVNGIRMAANGYKKSLPQDAKADQKMLLHYVSKHFSLVERNTQALMRENAFRMGAIEQIISELREFQLRHESHSKILNQLNDSIPRMSDQQNEHSNAIDALNDKLIKALTKNEHRHRLHDTTFTTLSNQFNQSITKCADQQNEHSNAIDAFNKKLIKVLTENEQRHRLHDTTFTTLSNQFNQSTTKWSDLQYEHSNAINVLNNTLIKANSSLSELRFENGIRINSIRILEERLQEFEGRTFRRRCQRLFSWLKSKLHTCNAP
jgi:hypothetical protein